MFWRLALKTSERYTEWKAAMRSACSEPSNTQNRNSTRAGAHTCMEWRRLLPVRFFSKWYCATSGVNVLASRFMLASNRYIVREGANIKVCLYQVMIINGLFEETNQQHMFSEVFYN